MWRILSAKYGVLDPLAVVEPYEHTLNKMPIAARREWARDALASLLTLVAAGDTVVFLAGERYREHLVSPLREAGIRVEIPMEGLQIGRQLQWLSKATL